MPSKMEMLMRKIRQWVIVRMKHHTENHFDASRDANRQVLREPSGNAVSMGGEFDKSPLHSSSVFPNDSLLFIEAWCGCALLSSCVAKLGFEVMPIDFEGNKQRPYMHVVQLDLRKRETWQFLRYVAESRRPFHSTLRHLVALRPELEIFQCHLQIMVRHRSGRGDGHLDFRIYLDIGLEVLSANQIYLQLCAFCEFLNTLNGALKIRPTATCGAFVITRG